MRTAVAAFILAFACAIASAQTVVPRFHGTAEVHVANVDVVVFDKDGKPVHGLQAADFEVLQDGSPRPITNFSELVASAPAETPAAPAERRIAIFVDNLTLHPFTRNEVFRSAIDFLRQSWRAGDLGMIVVMNGAPRTAVKWTSDPAILIAALDAMRKEASHGASRLAAMRAMQAEIAAASDRRMGLQAAQIYAQLVTDESTRTLRALQSTIYAMAGTEGRKALLLISDGIPQQPGLDAFRYVDSLFSVDSAHQDIRPPDVNDAIARVVQSANVAGVSIYPIHAQGLTGLGEALADFGTTLRIMTPSTDPRSNTPDRMFGVRRMQPPGFTEMLQAQAGESEAIHAAFGTMADQTGGLAIIGTSDFAKAFRAVAGELSSYYSIGFKPADAKADVAQRVEVRVLRKGLTARTRTSFATRSLDAVTRDRVVAALMGSDDPNKYGVMIDFGSQAPDGQKVRVPIRIRIPMESFTLAEGENGSARGEFTLFFRIADDRGGMTTEQEKRCRFVVPPNDLGKIAGQFYTFQFELLVAKGEFTVAAGILDHVSNASSIATTTLSVGS